MARAEARDRLLEAATALGSARGVGALTVQGIATAAGVSKALVLYHFGDKDAVLVALAARVADHDMARIREAAAEADPLEGWRRLASDTGGGGARALLAALLLEPAVRPAAAAIRQKREEAATALGGAVLARVGLRPRHAPALIGRVVLHQLDGVAVAHPGGADGHAASALDASLDAFALALLALGD